VPVVSDANGPRPILVHAGKQVLNLASYNFTGLSGNETTKMRAIETLRKSDVYSCGRPGFYGTIGTSIYSQFTAVVNCFVP
jgi:serine palmitoyltransferase